MLVPAQLPPRHGPPRPPLPPGTATVSGRIIDAITEKPVADIDVELTTTEPAERGSGTVIRSNSPAGIAHTNSDGVFSFPKIAAGNYRLLTISRTHLPACFGSSRQFAAPCLSIDLHDGEDRRNIDVFVRPAAFIKGRVVDDDGAPVAMASVRVMWDIDRLGGFERTGPDGRFEMWGILPGTISLVAEVNGKKGEGIIRAYYPGVLQPSDAVSLNIDPGSSTEVEIRIPKIIMGSLNAHVSGPDGLRIDRLTMTELDSKKRIFLTREDDGIARATYVREGHYVIEARGSADGKCLAAFADTRVDESTIDVPVDLVEAGSVTGRVVAERGGLPPLGNVRIAAIWMMEGAAVDTEKWDSTAVAADGSFSFDCLFGSRVFQAVALDPAWQVVGIRAGRTEIAGSEYVVESGSRTQLTITVGRK